MGTSRSSLQPPPLGEEKGGEENNTETKRDRQDPRSVHQSQLLPVSPKGLLEHHGVTRKGKGHDLIIAIIQDMFSFAHIALSAGT